MGKKKEIIISVIIIVLLAIGAILIFNKLKLSEQNKNQNMRYKLVKYADMDGKITQILDFDVIDDYSTPYGELKLNYCYVMLVNNNNNIKYYVTLLDDTDHMVFFKWSRC